MSLHSGYIFLALAVILFLAGLWFLAPGASGSMVSDNSFAVLLILAAAMCFFMAYQYSPIGSWLRV